MSEGYKQTCDDCQMMNRAGYVGKGCYTHNLEAELKIQDEANDILQARVKSLEDALNCRGVHTCHDQCVNWICLMRKENAHLRKALERISKMGKQTNAGHIMHGPWTIAKDALRELDGEKCPDCELLKKWCGIHGDK